MFFVASVLVLALSPDDPPKPPDVKRPDCKIPALREELLKRVEIDQKARTSVMEVMNKHGGQINGKPPASIPEFARLLEVDTANTKRMKEIVKGHGWPGKTLVGEDGAHAAWLLVQHADHDRDFQKECLKLLESMPQGDVSSKDFAYLTDRVLVGDGKPQRYGTQLRMEKGKLTPASLEDPENVDKRRQEKGLGPLADYIKFAAEQMAPNDERKRRESKSK